MNLIPLSGAALGVIVLALSSCVGYDPYAYGPGGGYGHSAGYYDTYGYAPPPLLAPRSSSVSVAYFGGGSLWNRSGYGHSTVRASPAYCPPASSSRSLGHRSVGSPPVIASGHPGHHGGPAASGFSRPSGSGFGGASLSRGTSGHGGSHSRSPTVSIPPPTPRSSGATSGRRSGGSLGSPSSTPPSMPSFNRGGSSRASTSSASSAGAPSRQYPMVRADGTPSSSENRAPAMDRMRGGGGR